MNTYLVICEDGSRYDAPTANDARLKLTKKGNVKLLTPDGERDVVEVESPATAIYKLTLVSGADVLAESVAA